jgi:hypothetical protein
MLMPEAFTPHEFRYKRTGPLLDEAGVEAAGGGVAVLLLEPPVVKL